MTIKDILLDFLYFVLILGVIVFSIVFFVLGDRVGDMSAIMLRLVPFSFFGVLILIQLKVTRSKMFYENKQADMDLILYLSYWDKIKAEIITYVLPIIILLVGVLAGDFSSTDVIQSGIAFIVIYTWYKLLFSKTSR